MSSWWRAIAVQLELDLPTTTGGHSWPRVIATELGIDVNSPSWERALAETLGFEQEGSSWARILTPTDAAHASSWARALYQSEAVSVGPRITFDVQTLLESASIGTLAALLGIANSPDGVTWTFALGGSAPTAFEIDGVDDTRLEVAEALNYEDITSYDVPIVATPSVGDPIYRTVTLDITNVIETPVNVTPPVVTFTDHEVGGSYVCGTGVWTDMQAGTYAYQWRDAADDSAVDGATTNTLLRTSDMVGTEFYCDVTPTNSAGSGTPEPSNTVGPVVESSAFVHSMDFSDLRNSGYAGAIGV